ncbi:hypothetical protein F050043D4_38520 [Bacteroides thetaiotaomicron]
MDIKRIVFVSVILVIGYSISIKAQEKCDITVKMILGIKAENKMLRYFT